MAVAQRRQREREARREAILDAAEAVVTRRGFAGLTMEAVAREAELSKGALYLYFDQRDALCAAIAHRTLSGFLEELAAALESAPDGLGATAELLRTQARFFDARPSHLRFAVSWMVSPDALQADGEDFAQYRQKLGELMALVVRTLQRGQVDGSIRADLDPLPVSQQLWASAVGVFIMRVQREQMQKRSPMPFDPDRLLELHIEQTLRALAARPRPTETP